MSRVQLFTLHAFGLSPATSLAMPCWTCPSFDSLGRCPLPSESSWTTHSEDTSSPSFGPSYTDLQLVSAGEQSGLASGADSTDNSSSLQEDEEVEMEAISWQAGSPAMNGHPTTPVTSARFPSWVTFDDNEVSGPLSPITSPLKPETLPLASVTPDGPYNSTGSFKKRERPKSSLMNFSKVQKLDVSSVSRPPAVPEAPPWRATNPFLNETLQDVQPSPINPFRAFFEEQERRAQSSSVSSTLGKSQRDSLIVVYRDAISFDDSSRNQSRSDAVEKLKRLQIEDSDHLGGVTLPDDDPAAWAELDAHPAGSEQSPPRDGWPMMLRIPEKKNIMSSRHWGPIYIKLTDGGYLQLYYEQGLERPFREFKLEMYHEISEPRLQNYDENGRIHSLRIDRVTYKEKKKYQPKPAVAHLAEREQVIKLGTTNYEDFLSFIRAVQDRLMELPVLSTELSTVGLNYLEEEMTVDAQDEFSGQYPRQEPERFPHCRSPTPSVLMTRAETSHAGCCGKTQEAPNRGFHHLGGVTLPDDDPAAWAELDAHPAGSEQSPPRDGWPMMLRIPEKKNIMSSRHWGPIYIKLTDGGYLQLYYEQGLERPFREFKLEMYHEISEPRSKTTARMVGSTACG
uniref:SHD domain-containing protein n=1 Tax=Bos mutus grunniens TaxID=30521 RepID=A0A8B9XWH2_BOSMU